MLFWKLNTSGQHGRVPEHTTSGISKHGKSKLMKTKGSSSSTIFTGMRRLMNFIEIMIIDEQD
jgi:hypothetical protein